MLLKLATSGGGERVNESPEDGGPARNGPGERATPLKPQVSLCRHVDFAFCSTIRISVFNYKSNMAMARSWGRLGSLASQLLEGLGTPCPYALIHGSSSVSSPPWGLLEFSSGV